MLSSTSMSAPVYTGRDSFVEMAKLVSAIMRAIVSCGRERLLQKSSDGRSGKSSDAVPEIL